MLSQRNTHYWLWFLLFGVVSALLTFSKGDGITTVKVFKNPSVLTACQASEQEADADERDERLRRTGWPFVILAQP
jgi:hypothetical protein